MAYVTKYTVPFRSILNKACEFRIQEEGYSGASTELTGMALPVSRSGKGDNDELEDRIIRSECRVMVNSETDYQFINLFTADARKYRGQLYIDSALEWQGFLTPDYYSEPYIPAPYDVALLFTDGLGQLKGKDFTIPYTYNYSNGYMAKLSDILKMCIEETGNLLGYYEAVNIHEENMDTDKSMLIQTYCDIRRFNDKTYYDVLDEILKCANNARLWLQEGKWWIVPINVMKTTSFTVRNSLDSVSNLLSSSTVTLDAGAEDYKYENLYTLARNTTYTLSLLSKLNSGTATGYTVLLYSLTSLVGETPQTLQFNDVTKQIYTFTTPDTDIVYNLLIYAGIAGSTSGNNTTYTAMLLETGTGSIINISPRIATTNTTATPLNVFLDSPELLMLPAWKRFYLKQDLGYNDDMMKNANYQIVGTGWAVYENSEGYISMQTGPMVGDLNYIEFNLGTIIYTENVAEYLQVALKAYGPASVSFSMEVYIDRSPEVDYYLSMTDIAGEGEWLTGARPLYNRTMDKSFPTIKSNAIPITGTLKVRVYRPRSSSYTGYVGFNRNDIQVNIIPSFDVADEINIQTTINDSQNFIPTEYEMMLGDLIYPLTRTVTVSPPIPGGLPVKLPIIETFVNQGLVYLGGLYWLNGTTYTPTQYWLKVGSTDKKRLVNLIADEICSNHVRPMAMITGSLRCNFKPGSIIKTSVGHDKLFVIKRFTQNFYDDEWECDLVEFASADQGYLKLRSGGYVKLRNGGKIKLR